MSTHDQARALMSRHYHSVKNRQQSMLGRAAAEIGIDDTHDYWTTIQGKPQPTFSKNYDRSRSAMS